MSKIFLGKHWIKYEDVRLHTPQNDNEKRVIEIISDWQNGRLSFEFHTSGSTGKPKKITLKREQLEASAKATIDALQLSSDQVACLCINPRFIGGTMMLIRAVISNMSIVVYEATANPLKGVNQKIDFIALVPLQLHEILKDPESDKKLAKIRKVIVGGGRVPTSMLDKLKGLPGEVYSTYGMTETVSHIALRKLNGQDRSEHYHVLDSVHIKLDQRGCLIINAPCTNHEDVVTNDIVELIDNQTFKWLGRIDHVINTGGIKINGEALEESIENIFNHNDFKKNFFISSLPDDKLGQKIVLFIEANSVSDTLMQQIKSGLSKYEHPKQVIVIDSFDYTPNGKIDRVLTRKRYLDSLIN